MGIHNYTTAISRTFSENNLLHLYTNFSLITYYSYG